MKTHIKEKAIATLEIDANYFVKQFNIEILLEKNKNFKCDIIDKNQKYSKFMLAMLLL